MSRRGLRMEVPQRTRSWRSLRSPRSNVTDEPTSPQSSGEESSFESSEEEEEFLRDPLRAETVELSHYGLPRLAAYSGIQNSVEKIGTGILAACKAHQSLAETAFTSTNSHLNKIKKELETLTNLLAKSEKASIDECSPYNLYWRNITFGDMEANEDDKARDIVKEWTEGFGVLDSYQEDINAYNEFVDKKQKDLLLMYKQGGKVKSVLNALDKIQNVVDTNFEKQKSAIAQIRDRASLTFRAVQDRTPGKLLGVIMDKTVLPHRDAIECIVCEPGACCSICTDIKPLSPEDTLTAENLLVKCSDTDTAHSVCLACVAECMFSGTPNCTFDDGHMCCPACRTEFYLISAPLVYAADDSCARDLTVGDLRAVRTTRKRSRTPEKDKPATKKVKTSSS